MSADHVGAAARHEAAAANHDRAARFWEDHGDASRAELQRELAEYERGGATLERRWADLVDADAAHGPARGAGIVLRHIRLGAKQLSANLARTAEALERSANLAEQHAQRREQSQQIDDAAQERKAAQRAREAAGHARAQAEEWLKISERE
jgi:hypothetical protein